MKGWSEKEAGGRAAAMEGEKGRRGGLESRLAGFARVGSAMERTVPGSSHSLGASTAAAASVPLS